MGGGSSTQNTSNVRTRLAVEAVARNIMNCQSNTTVVQRFVISGSYNVVQGVRQVQNIKLSTRCAQDAQNIADLQQSVSSALKQAAESQSVSVLGALGSSSSEINSTIDNEVSQTVTQENIQNIINNSNAQQDAYITGNHNIVKDFSQEQTFGIVYDNSQKLLNSMKSVQVIENATATQATATQTNFVSDILDSVFSGLQGMGWIWVVILAIGAYVAVQFGPAAFLGEDEKGNVIPVAQYMQRAQPTYTPIPPG